MVPSPVNMAGGPKFLNSVPLFFAASFCDMGTGVYTETVCYSITYILHSDL
jgi:hypothetical protein